MVGRHGIVRGRLLAMVLSVYDRAGAAGIDFGRAKSITVSARRDVVARLRKATGSMMRADNWTLMR